MDDILTYLLRIINNYYKNFKFPFISFKELYPFLFKILFNSLLILLKHSGPSFSKIVATWIASAPASKNSNASNPDFIPPTPIMSTLFFKSS